MLTGMENTPLTSVLFSMVSFVLLFFILMAVGKE